MAHGGKREGSGRKKLSNRYKEQTHPVRIPLSLLSTVQVLLQKKSQYHESNESNTPFIPHPTALSLERPLFLNAVSAGIPSAANDCIDNAIDLNTHLISNPSTTFFVRVAGDSMNDANIFDGDLLVVDRSSKPRTRDIVIAIVDGGLNALFLLITRLCFKLKILNMTIFTCITIGTSAYGELLCMSSIKLEKHWHESYLKCCKKFRINSNKNSKPSECFFARINFLRKSYC